MLNKENRPKWKHMGRKSKWLYPAYLPFNNGTFVDVIEKKQEVIIVESIGDLLSLHEHGHHNVLVSFGLDISPSLIAFLVQVNPQRLIISFNNDATQQENRGLNGAIKNYLKLLSYFAHQKLFVCLPLHNDFGDMNGDNFEKWAKKLDNLNPATHARKVLEESRYLANSKELSKNLIKNRNILAEISNV